MKKALVILVVLLVSSSICYADWTTIYDNVAAGNDGTDWFWFVGCSHYGTRDHILRVHYYYDPSLSGNLGIVNVVGRIQRTEFYGDGVGENIYQQSLLLGWNSFTIEFPVEPIYLYKVTTRTTNSSPVPIRIVIQANLCNTYGLIKEVQ